MALEISLCDTFDGDNESFMDGAPLLYRLAKEKRFDEILERATSHPEEALWADKYDQTVLHRFAFFLTSGEERNHPDRPIVLRVMNIIVTRYPRLIATPLPRSMGRTPLHLLTEDGISNDLVQIILCMVHANPDAIVMPDDYGFTPFHHCIIRPTSQYTHLYNKSWDVTILRAMLEANPTLVFKCVLFVMECRVHHWVEAPLELHESVWSEEEEKMELLLLVMYHTSIPALLSPRSLLHAAACAYLCHRKYLTRLMNNDPTLLYERDEQGDLPLHCAVRDASLDLHEVFGTDNEIRPLGTEKRNRALVIHQLNIQGYSAFVVEQLLKAYPAAASKKNDDGQLPLHVAMSGSQWATIKLRTVQNLLEAHPLAAAEKDNDGNLPLHVALAGSRWSVSKTRAIEKILEVYPSGAKQMNNDGELPMHIVLKGDWLVLKENIIWKLFEAYPDCLYVRGTKDKLPPAFVSALRADESSNRFSTTYALLRRKPEVCYSSITEFEPPKETSDEHLVI